MKFQKIVFSIIRQHRDQLLKESDWTQLPDSALSAESKTLWKQYRQQLRDIPQTVDISAITHWDDAVAAKVFPPKP